MILSIVLLLSLPHVLQEETPVNLTTLSNPSYKLVSSNTDDPHFYKFTLRSEFVPDDLVTVLQAVRIHNNNNYNILFFPVLSLEWAMLNQDCCDKVSINTILKYYEKNSFCVSKWNDYGVEMLVTSVKPSDCTGLVKVGKIKAYNGFEMFLERIKRGIVLIYYYVHNIDMLGDKKPLDVELVLVNKLIKVVDEKEGKVQYYISILRHTTDEIWIVINENEGELDKSELGDEFDFVYWVMEKGKEPSTQN